MTKLGFSRYKCEKCGEYFWRHNDSVKVRNKPSPHSTLLFFNAMVYDGGKIGVR